MVQTVPQEQFHPINNHHEMTHESVYPRKPVTHAGIRRQTVQILRFRPLDKSRLPRYNIHSIAIWQFPHHEVLHVVFFLLT